MNKKHIIYRTTNILNNRYYIGMHSTENIDDGYLGSGRRIKAEIKKYGKENFVREVLEMLPSREALKLREMEIVNAELLVDKFCLNLKDGGEGGFDHLNNGSAEHRIRASRAASNRNRSLAGTETAKNAGKKAARTREERGHKSKWGTSQGMLGKKHTEESKLQMSIRRSGNQNGSFGTCWVKKDGSSLKINKQELDEYVKNGYLPGRTMNKAGEVFIDTCGPSKPE